MTLRRYYICVKVKCACQTVCGHLVLSLSCWDLIMHVKNLGILQGELGLTHGLSALILWLGIRPCVSQICPYVTKSPWRLSAGWAAGTTKHSSVLAVLTSGISYFIRCLFIALV